MAYRSILTVLTQGDDMAAILTAAVDLARREDAHLDVFCLGIDRTQVGYYYVGAMAVIQQETIEQAEREAAALAEAARARLAPEDIRWGVDAAVAQIGSLGTVVADRARYADLVVLPRPYGAGRPPESEAILEAALFEGQAAVLVFAGTTLPEEPPRRLVVAWNRSAEALVAVRRALPLLRKAEMVSIAVIDPPAHGPEQAEPGGRLSQMLARHGVKAEVALLPKTLPRVSEVLSRHAVDVAADLVVMGAYGHSRFREAILGGTTREMLEASPVPVFLAH